MKDKIFQYPTDGVLDLHTFLPKEAADVTREYIRACHSEGIYHLRIIHGKGTGALRATVHAVLAKSTLVKYWKTSTDSSSWGATLVKLKPQVDSEHA